MQREESRPVTRAPWVGMRRLSALLLVVVGSVLLPSAATADNIGYQGFSYSDENDVQIPTDSKPQSKLWYAHDRW